jgi:hypothetical protein
MNILDVLFETKSGRRQIKPQIIMTGIVLSFVVFVFFFLLAQRQAAKDRQSPGPFVVQKAPPPRNLDYQIVKVDTIPFGHLTPPSTGASAQSSWQTSRQSGGQASISQPERSAPREYVAPPPTTGINSGSPGVGQQGDMIVVSTLDQRQGAAAIGSFPGLQSLRLKVVLPEKTPVMNGSLVEVRVMKDERFNNLEIPRRSKLLGICTLQNNRVQIDFREIRIGDVNYTCSGRAYDLKSLPGIPYFPLDARAKQALLDELKNAASGVPILGRYLNQPDVNPLTDEITTLEEGLEFYALITNIFSF